MGAGTEIGGSLTEVGDDYNMQDLQEDLLGELQNHPGNNSGALRDSLKVGCRESEFCEDQLEFGGNRGLCEKYENDVLGRPG